MPFTAAWTENAPECAGGIWGDVARRCHEQAAEHVVPLHLLAIYAMHEHQPAAVLINRLTDTGKRLAIIHTED